MPKFNGRLPKYRLHRASGKAVVTLNHTNHYLGVYSTEESRAAYDRKIGEWLANHRQPLVAGPKHATGLLIGEVILNFWEHAKHYYKRPDGTIRSEVDNHRQAIRPLRRLYGKTPAADFGPLALEALRQHMIGLGWCRKNINKQIHRNSTGLRPSLPAAACSPSAPTDQSEEAPSLGERSRVEDPAWRKALGRIGSLAKGASLASSSTTPQRQHRYPT